MDIFGTAEWVPLVITGTLALVFAILAALANRR